MKNTILLISLLALIIGCSNSEKEGDISEANWMTNYEEALELAARENKPVLLNFTGSDWCPPCRQLKKEVFSTAAFKKFAGENLVLLELDFPRGRPQKPELARQNQELAERYRVEGFPTLVLLAPNGQEAKRSINWPGTRDEFLEWTRL